jgi:hypothetical protein
MIVSGTPTNSGHSTLMSAVITPSLRRRCSRRATAGTDRHTASEISRCATMLFACTIFRIARSNSSRLGYWGSAGGGGIFLMSDHIAL